jgi:hypothetical protein
VFYTALRAWKGRALLVTIVLGVSRTTPGAHAASANRKPGGKSIKLTSGALTITMKRSVYTALDKPHNP